MTIRLKIYGYSDDLIEVEGDIEEEFNVNEGAAFIGFSDGTLLRAIFSTDGWLFRIIQVGTALVTYQIHNETVEDDIVNLTFTLTREHFWVMCSERVLSKNA